MATSGLPATAEPSAKRRKIRKGTRSCWECKRRKYKCTWSRSVTDCDGCQSRGTACISQEFPDNHLSLEKRPGASSRPPDDGRLQHVEDLLKELIRKVDSGHARADVPENISNDGPFDSPLALLESSASNSFADPSSKGLGHDVLGETRALMNILRPPLPRAVPGTSLGQFGEVTGEVTPLAHALITAWPSEDHRDAILSRSLANTGSLHPAMSVACSGSRTVPSPKDMLQLPSSGSNPLAIARKLLLLSTYLQVASSHAEHSASGLAPNYRDLMTRAFETVNKLVTHNDDLPASIEIVQCLITESQYHNYTGDIQRAWITVSRALAMAQLIGLDRQSTGAIHNLETYGDDDSMRSRQENVWFLLVHFSQYLSIMLGISTSLPEYDQAEPELLESCYKFTPSERMGRLHSMVVGRILRRNRMDMYNIVETRKIDKILQMAMACMPPKWWLPPKVTPDNGTDEKESAALIDRLMVHFAHYNILLQLHLPCMLRSLTTGNQSNNYSTTAVINASRELLTRFTAYRSRYPTVSYCRGLDFFAFVASTALCLLHIHGSSCLSRQYANTDNKISDLLAHQRVTHRGLMEDALERIQKLSHARHRPDNINNNTIISELVPTFQRLLAVEDEASRGGDGNFNIRLLPNAGLLGVSNLSKSSGDSDGNGDDVLNVNLPFCGTIKIERVSASSTMQVLSDVQNSFTETTYAMEKALDFTSAPAAFSEGCHPHAHHQAVDLEPANTLISAPTPSLLTISDQVPNIDTTGALDDVVLTPQDTEGVDGFEESDGQEIVSGFFQSFLEI